LALLRQVTYVAGVVVRVVGAAGAPIAPSVGLGFNTYRNDPVALLLPTKATCVPSSDNTGDVATTQVLQLSPVPVVCYAQ